MVQKWSTEKCMVCFFLFSRLLSVPSANPRGQGSKKRESTLLLRYKETIPASFSFRTCELWFTEMHIFFVSSQVTEPLELVGMDLVGKLTLTDGGNQYICVMVDYYTKWAEAYPLKSKTADEVSKLYY